MDYKKAPLVQQIKNAQFALATHLGKTLKITILVPNILVSNDMSRKSFCRDLGGKVKLDWSQDTILVGKEIVTLQPNGKSMYIPFIRRSLRPNSMQ